MLRFKPSLLIVMAVLLATVLALLPVTDELGREHVDTAFKRALAAAAIARGLNGVISVAQGTELAIQPAGVGVSFTPGEILDPVNDLIERFSWIMLLATSSLGVQKVLLQMSGWHGLILLILIVAVMLMATHVFQTKTFFNSKQVKAVLGRLFLFLLLLRFMMPLIAIANEMVYRTFLQSNYVESSAQLQQASEAIGDINDEVVADNKLPSGLLERAADMYSQFVNKVDLERRYERYRAAAGSIGESTVNIIVVFIMQTLVFPLLFLGILLGVIRRLSHWNGT